MKTILPENEKLLIPRHLVHLHNQGDPLLNGYPNFVKEGMSWQDSQLIGLNPLINSVELMPVLIVSFLLLSELKPS